MAELWYNIREGKVRINEKICRKHACRQIVEFIRRAPANEEMRSISEIAERICYTRMEKQFQREVT